MSESNDLQEHDATTGESIEATSLRAFSIDAPPASAKDADETDASAPISKKEKANASPSDAVESDARSSTLRVPLGAKVLFGVVLGGCAVVLALSAPKLRAEIAAKNVAKNARVSVAVPAAPPATPPVAAALIAATPSTPALPPPAAPASDPAVVAARPADEKVSEPSKESKATIRISKKGHTLKVDGKAVKGMSVDVTCGRHMVAVDTEKPHRVETTCGQTVTVDAQRAHDDKKPHVAKHPKSPLLR